MLLRDQLVEKVSGALTVPDAARVPTPTRVIQYQENVTANPAGVADAASQVTMS